MIVQIDASKIGYGGIFKQKKLASDSFKQTVEYHSGIWNRVQQNYSTIKKELLSIISRVSKLQDDLLNKKFLLRKDCQTAVEIPQRDVQNIISQQICTH